MDTSVCVKSFITFTHYGEQRMSPQGHTFTCSSAEMHINVAAYLKTNLCEAIKNITIGYNRS